MPREVTEAPKWQVPFSIELNHHPSIFAFERRTTDGVGLLGAFRVLFLSFFFSFLFLSFSMFLLLGHHHMPLAAFAFTDVAQS